MPNVPHSYEVNGKLVTGNGSLMPISSSTKRSLLPSLPVLLFSSFCVECLNISMKTMAKTYGLYRLF